MRISLPFSVLCDVVFSIGMKNGLLEEDQEITVELTNCLGSDNWVSFSILHNDGQVDVVLENTSTGLKRYFPNC